LGIADQLPAARRKISPVNMTVAAAVLLDPRGRTLLVRRPNGDGAVFARLWQFPAVEAAGDPRQALGVHLRGLTRASLDAILQPLRPARHTVTVRNIQLLPFLVRVPRLPAVPGARTPPLAALDRLAVSNATRKIAGAALQAL
jgi:hypothetical protein